MDYAAARPLICNGDHVAIYGTDVKAKVIAWAQRWAKLPHPGATHVGIAYHEGDRLYLAHIIGTGNASVYLSQYADHTLVISAAPVDFDRDALDYCLESHQRYGFLDLVRIGVRLIFMRWFIVGDLGGDSYEDLVCSQFTSRFYGMCGWTKKVAKLIAPAEITAHLQERFVINPKEKTL